jgi:hypothetical protein
VAWACYPWQLSRISRLAPQTNTNLFSALCPHSCAPGKDFPVGHPSPNHSGPKTLNPEFLWSEFPEKKLQLVDMSILLILLSPGQGMSHNTPARWPGPVTPGSSLRFLDWPHRSTLVFSVHFVLTRAHPRTTSRLVTHPQFAPGQARLTWSSF